MPSVRIELTYQRFSVSRRHQTAQEAEVPAPGLEPGTFRLRVCYSSRLSYAGLWKRGVSLLLNFIAGFVPAPLFDTPDGTRTRIPRIKSSVPNH